MKLASAQRTGRPPNAGAHNGTLVVVAGVLLDGEGRVLVAQRPAGKKIGGAWELPGGKVEYGEDVEAALQRELLEEVGARALTWQPLTFAATRNLPAEPSPRVRRVVMLVFLVREWEGDARGAEGQAVRWVAPGDLLQATPRQCSATASLLTADVLQQPYSCVSAVHASAHRCLRRMQPAFLVLSRPRATVCLGA